MHAGLAHPAAVPASPAASSASHTQVRARARRACARDGGTRSFVGTHTWQAPWSLHQPHARRLTNGLPACDGAHAAAAAALSTEQQPAGATAAVAPLPPSPQQRQQLQQQQQPAAAPRRNLLLGLAAAGLAAAAPPAAIASVAPPPAPGLAGRISGMLPVPLPMPLGGPQPVGFPRKNLDLRFAVLLMRR